MKDLIFIVGATASGKTDWAIEWARQTQIHFNKKPVGILNSDSIQIYKELNIGSAKPTLSNYPDINFYLFNELTAPELCTAGIFRKKALKILTEKLPQEQIFVVGGSGFYLQALEKGMYPVKKPDTNKTPTVDNLSNCLQKQPNNITTTFTEPKHKTINIDELYQKLKKWDPQTAQTISPKDKYRILRALELIQQEGKALSQIKKEFQIQKLPWSYLKIGLEIPKDKLLERVQERIKKMLKKGLIQEVEVLLAKGLQDWRPLNSIGYKETRLYLAGEINKEELTELIVSNTMYLAKKQKTWFKKDNSIQWFDWDLSPLKIYEKILQR